MNMIHLYLEGVPKIRSFLDLDARIDKSGVEEVKTLNSGEPYLGFKGI